MVTATGPAPGSEMNHENANARPHRNTCGALSMPAIFDDGMVLQRETPIAVFGSARTNGGSGTPTVTVRLIDEHGRQTATTNAETDPETGQWTAQLPALPASGPYELHVEAGDDRLRFTDVHIGVVWLAGGQSNMEVELRNSDDAEQALAQCADPLLRFYNVPKTGVIDETAENAASWQESSPQASGVMSAIAYYFARRLRAKLGPDIAVGIVDCYIGGTSVTCWMSRKTLESCAAGRAYLDRYDQAVAGKSMDELHAAANAWQHDFNAWNASIAAARQADPDVTWDTLNEQYGACPWPPPVTPFSQWHTCGAFEAMVQRIAPYTLEGVLWYQGEEDEPYCETYRELLGMMIAEWRDLWHRADLPFLLAQLPQWIDKKVDESTGDPMLWPVIRAAQWDAAHTIDGVHAVCLMDCGEYDNIHPTDKRTPGERLAACALRYVYGFSGEPVGSPEMLDAQVSGAGRVEVRFAHAVGLHFDGSDPASRRDAERRARENASMTVRDADLSGFEIAGADGVFQPVAAQIVTDGDAGHSGPDSVGSTGSAGSTVADVSASSASPSADQHECGCARETTWTADYEQDRTDFDNSSSSVGSADSAIGTVLLTVPEGVRPAAVRYAWRSWGPAPLFNADNLPAAPGTRAL